MVMTAGLFETESNQSGVVQSSLDHSRVSEDQLQSSLFQKWKKTRPDQTLKHYSGSVLNQSWSALLIRLIPFLLPTTL